MRRGLDVGKDVGPRERVDRTSVSRARRSPGGPYQTHPVGVVPPTTVTLLGGEAPGRLTDWGPLVSLTPFLQTHLDPPYPSVGRDGWRTELKG